MGLTRPWIVLGALAATLCRSAVARSEEAPPLTGYSHAKWTHKQGLPGTSVRNIVQTPDGYIWVITDAALARFDGVRFTAFSSFPGVPATIGVGLCGDADGSLWVGLIEGGVVNLRNGSPIYHPPGNGLLPGAVRAMLRARDNAIWVLTAEGVSRYGGGHWRGFPIPVASTERLEAMVEDRDGTIAVATMGGLYLKKTSDEAFHLDPAIASVVKGVSTDPDGVLSVAGLSGCGPVLNGRPPQGLSCLSWIRTFFRDRNGGVWFTKFPVAGGGVFLSRHPTEFMKMEGSEHFGVAQGLTGDSVRKFFEDVEGNIWVGTDNGLDRFSPSSFHVLNLPSLQSGTMGMELYNAADGGLLLGPYSEAENFHVSPEKTEVESAGNLWSGGSFNPPGPVVVPPRVAPPFMVESGRRGTTRVRVPGSRRFDDYPDYRFQPNPSVFQPDYEIRFGASVHAHESFFSGYIFTRDPSGQIWMARKTGGLFQVTVNQIVPAPGMARNDIIAVACDQSGQLWAGGTGGLFGRIGGGWRQYTRADGMFRGRVTAFYLGRDGSFWILGTSAARLKNGKLASFEGNLDFRNAFSMVEDDDGFTWFAAPTGIFRVAANELERASTEPHYQLPYRHFDEADGLPSIPDGRRLQCARTADGRLWFVLRDGVVSIDPHQVMNGLAPPVVIEAAVINGKRSQPAAGIRLPPGTRALRIEYTALSYVVPERVRFKVKLEGFDPDWVDVGGRREAVYTNLNPKAYRFRVIACNHAGVWNEAGASWEFRVLPAFYQTYWFGGLSIVAAGLSLWILCRMRMRSATRVIQGRYEERLAERTRIARDLHDTLLQTLAGASLQLDAISKRDPATTDETRQKICCIREQVDASFREARQKVWDLRSPALDGRDLPSALREWVDRMTGDLQQLRLNIIGEHRPLPAHIEEQLLRIGQEGVTNSMRHAQGGTIAVDLTYETERLVLCVSDDGRGFDTKAIAQRNGHWGLKNMQERAKEIGAQWSIKSALGQGTKIETILPARSNGKHRQ